MPDLIGLSGPAGAGKSTAARVLRRHGWARVKFAGPLKAMLRAMLTEAGVPPSEIRRMIEGDLKETPQPILGGRTPRHAMQTLGTEWGRSCMAADLWVTLAAARIAGLLAAGRNVVVDDVRFANEAALIRSMGGRVVLIDRPGVTPVGTHASEAGVPWDASILNDGRRAAFEREVEAALVR